MSTSSMGPLSERLQHLEGIQKAVLLRLRSAFVMTEMAHFSLIHD